ncbi:MAG: chromosomal replication initiator protein DnaA [Oscillospiraceae bacterium]|nr:chromosomal replication initiator protein DnaA [Oscillospiraceae bacterium]
MNSFTEVLNLVKENISHSGEISDTAYNLWIKPLEPVGFEGSTVVLAVQSNFQRNIVTAQYLPRIRSALEEVLGFPVTVELEVSEEEDTPPSAEEPEPRKPIVTSFTPTYEPATVIPQPPAAPAPSPAGEEGFVGNGSYEYTFENFIVGSRNEFTYTACKSIATADFSAPKPYNPLFIYGPSGLGKTHLLRAIQHEVHKRNPQLKIVYTTSENFTIDVVTHLDKRTMPEMREKYRNADFLLVDDIQFLSGKEASQEEFFHTFNDLYQHSKQIVLTSDRPPKDVQILEDRLRTRFESGLLADISPPDTETRIAIIRRKADLLKLDISDDIVNFIASKLKSNIRQLEGAVHKLKISQDLTGDPITLPSAQSVIREILNDEQPVTVTVEKIIEEVGRTFEVSPEDIRSNKRSGPISAARQVAIYIVRAITQISMKQIGQEFGGRDHTTIVYTLKKVEETMKTNPHEKGIIEDLIKNIRDK